MKGRSLAADGARKSTATKRPRRTVARLCSVQPTACLERRARCPARRGNLGRVAIIVSLFRLLLAPSLCNRTDGRSAGQRSPGMFAW
jgi:hypothetical protein